MSFRLRIVFMTTALITLLFSVGGAVLIHTTFLASIEKEEQAAVDDSQFLLKILQVVGEDGEWFGEKEMVSLIQNMDLQESMDCLVLTQEENVIYRYQRKENLIDQMTLNLEPEERQVLITFFSVDDTEKFLQTTTRVMLNGKIYYLNIGRNLTPIYEVRQEQIGVFRRTFWVLLVLGEALSWLLAAVLTRPLRSLTKASREIGGGNLKYRSNITSDDEIGTLSEEFDKMADQLEDHICLLQEAAEQKEQFMGAFTHELKTPMTSIIGYADLLRTQKLTPEDEEDALDYIFSEAKRLENLSLKMLDLFVADKKELVMKECSPAALVEYVARHLQPVYEKKSIFIQTDTVPGKCLIEPDLFQTLLINLLDNAKKSMEQGGMIFVSVRMTEQGCVLKVKDQGKGIPKEAMKHITEAFYRADKARARSEGSAGLGLALCEKIVQLHRGRMTFESEEGRGTEVTVELCAEGGEKQ